MVSSATHRSQFFLSVFSVSSALLLPLGFLFSTSQSTKSDPKPLAHFMDIAKKAGLADPVVFGGVDTKKYILETTGTGVAIFDYDNDGWPDIFIVNGTTLENDRLSVKPPTSHLYRNNHDGTFTDVTQKAGLTHTGWGQGVCVGDYDNDGWEDLYVTYYGKNVLYHNNGDGTFTDVAEKAGVAGSGKAWGNGCAFVDYDRDGHADLIVANYVDFDLSTAPAPGDRATCMWKGAPVMCGPQGLRPANNTLYRNRGDGTFEDVTAKAHIDKADGHYSLSVSTLDYDNDGWPDIFVACDSTASILYHNNHDGTFTDVAIIAGAAFNEDGRAQAGMGSTVADYNGDGKLDIFKTNFSDDTATLYRNNGNGTFDDVTFPAGLGLNTKYLGWGTMFFDFDNDGWPDLLLVNGHVYPEVDSQHLGSTFQEPRILYHNNGNGTFADISAEAGPGITSSNSSRGLAIGDLWNDGRLNAVISNMNSPPSLLVNDIRTANHWIAFRLVGAFPTTRKQPSTRSQNASSMQAAEPREGSSSSPRSTAFYSSRDALGARITLKAGSRIFVDEARSGSSYDSNNDMRVHFGLGLLTKLDSIEVRWPSGLTERFDSLGVDKTHTIKEGSGAALKSQPQNTVK
jgi:enediyne biosynthesis protein E4